MAYFPLECIAIICECIAITCALLALYKEFRLDLIVKNIDRRVKDIEENLSNRHLADWPGHGNDLTAFIKSAEDDDELKIQLGTLGYLSFARPDEWDSIVKALLDAANRGVKTQLLTVNEDSAFQANKIQFGKGALDDFTELAPNKIEAYVKRHWKLIEKTPFGRKYHPGYKPKAEDRDDFINLTMFVEDDNCNKLTALGVSVRTTPDDSFIHGPFLWLRHKESVLKEMILAYTPFGGTQKGHAFRTCDVHQLEIYVNLFDRAFKEARSVGKFEHLFPGIFQSLENSAGEGFKSRRDNREALDDERRVFGSSESAPRETLASL